VTISASRARKNFYSLLQDVSGGFKKITITNKGEARAVLMHPDEVGAWEETMEILANKKLIADILKSETERVQKDTVSEEELLKSLDEN